VEGLAELAPRKAAAVDHDIERIELGVVTGGKMRKGSDRAFPLVRGSEFVALSAGFEPALMASEANALSPELRERNVTRIAVRLSNGPSGYLARLVEVE
jgi:hypothetical protein